MKNIIHKSFLALALITFGACQEKINLNTSEPSVNDDQDGDGYSSVVDCDDNDPTERPGVIWYTDTDGDGFGDEGASQECERNDNSDVLVAGDCDDTDETLNPNVTWYADVDGDGFGDPLQEANCKPTVSPSVLDGTDCDDNDSTEYPGVTWYIDADEDGFGNPNSSNECERSYSTDVLVGNDCDDLSSEVGDDAVWYADVDGDGFGDPSSSTACTRNAPSDVLDNTDCNDNEAGQYPGITWYADSDGDGFGDPDVSNDCEPNAASDILDNTDCNDNEAGQYPGITWYADSDGDGFGNLSSPSFCEPNEPSDVLDNTDCNDNASDQYPGVIWYVDFDRDGFGDPSTGSECQPLYLSDVTNNTDCNDTDAELNPLITWYADSDGDGFGDPNVSNICEPNNPTDILDNTDCDDTNAAYYPGLVWYVDADGDGFGDDARSSLCNPQNPTDTLISGDYADDNINRFPGATFDITGTASGIYKGAPPVLVILDSSDSYEVSGSGPFTIPDAVVDLESYQISIDSSASGLNCSLEGADGVQEIQGFDLNITISCECVYDHTIINLGFALVDDSWEDENQFFDINDLGMILYRSEEESDQGSLKWRCGNRAFTVDSIGSLVGIEIPDDTTGELVSADAQIEGFGARRAINNDGDIAYVAEIMPADDASFSLRNEPGVIYTGYPSNFRKEVIRRGEQMGPIEEIYGGSGTEVSINSNGQIAFRAHTQDDDDIEYIGIYESDTETINYFIDFPTTDADEMWLSDINERGEVLALAEDYIEDGSKKLYRFGNPVGSELLVQEFDPILDFFTTRISNPRFNDQGEIVMVLGHCPTLIEAEALADTRDESCLIEETTLEVSNQWGDSTRLVKVYHESLMFWKDGAFQEIARAGSTIDGIRIEGFTPFIDINNVGEVAFIVGEYGVSRVVEGASNTSGDEISHLFRWSSDQGLELVSRNLDIIGDYSLVEHQFVDITDDGSIFFKGSNAADDDQHAIFCNHPDTGTHMLIGEGLFFDNQHVETITMGELNFDHNTSEIGRVAVPVKFSNRPTQNLALLECESQPITSERVIEDICDDEIDNDGNGVADCDDSACSSERTCGRDLPVDDEQITIEGSLLYLADPIWWRPNADCTPHADNDESDPNSGLYLYDAYWFTNTTDQEVTVTANATFSDDGYLHVFNYLSATDEVECVRGNDDYLSRFQSTVTGITVAPGAEIVIYVSVSEPGEVSEYTLEVTPSNEEICDDDIDNDLNGAFDCADQIACEAPEGCNELCDDGLDNNGDTRIDCDDPRCAFDSACEIVAPLDENIINITGQINQDDFVWSRPNNACVIENINAQYFYDAITLTNTDAISHEYTVSVEWSPPSLGGFTDGYIHIYDSLFTTCLLGNDNESDESNSAITFTVDANTSVVVVLSSYDQSAVIDYSVTIQ